MLPLHHTPTRTAAVINEMLRGFTGFHSRIRILIRYSKAGVVGFEPTNTAVKVLWLSRLPTPQQILITHYFLFHL